MCGRENVPVFEDGWIVTGGTFAMLVTGGRIGCTYLEWPQEIEAV